MADRYQTVGSIFIAQALAVELQAKRHTDFALVQLYSGDITAYRNKDSPIVLYNALSTRNLVLSPVAIVWPDDAINKQNQAALLAWTYSDATYKTNAFNSFNQCFYRLRYPCIAG